MIGILVDYYMGAFSPEWSRDTNGLRVTVGSGRVEGERADLGHCMALLGTLVTGTLTEGMKMSGTSPPTVAVSKVIDLIEIPKKCKRLIYIRVSYILPFLLS